MSSGVEIKGLRVFYSRNEVIKGIDLTVPPSQVTAVIGPSGCGKTTLLRCLNRLGDLTKGCQVQGDIYLNGEDINRMDPIVLRRKVGMVFQKPNPFPMSVKENVLYGVKANNHRGIDYMSLVESSLKRVALWEELKDRLNDNAFNLSIGQQQRLCIARTIAVDPEIILMDEPCSALDPVATLKIEELVKELKSDYTIVIVTHNMQQAARVSDWTAFLFLGELVEYEQTGELFSRPQDKRTEDYITGMFG